MSLLLPTYRAKDYYIVLKRWTKKNSFIVYTIILVTQGRKEQIYFNNPISYNMITKRNNFLLSGLRTYLAQQQKKCNKCVQPGFANISSYHLSKKKIAKVIQICISPVDRVVNKLLRMCQEDHLHNACAV